jgi:hypothetical protein
MILEPTTPGGGKVTTRAVSFSLRRTGNSLRRTRRAIRFAILCEPLESRQLLSVGQSGVAANAFLNTATTAAQIPVSAQVFTPPQSNSSVLDVEFGSLSGVIELQFLVFGNGGVFSPTPTSSSAGSGLGLGTLAGTTGNSNTSSGTTGSLFPTSSTFNQSITPLNPSVTSSTNTPGGPPVALIPVQLVALPVHLSSSATPATNQSNSTLISNLDELPPAINHFGQGDAFDGQRVFMEKLDVKPQSSSLIDDIEPFRPIAPDVVPQGQPGLKGDQAPAPDDARVHPLPPINDPNVDAALDLTDASLMTRSRDTDASQPDDQFSSANTSWSFSAIFGAVAVATSGYHLALREADRFRGRWIPRWAGAERPTKRKATTPSR